MRFSKFSYVALTALVLFNSCSKDGTILSEEDQEIVAVDLTARSVSKKLYQDYYMASKSGTSDIAWSGSEAACNPGDVPQSTKDKIFKRIEYFRKAAGLNNIVSENVTKSEKAQHAALMMMANGTLDHFPPDSWKCFSVSGKDGAGNSLLTQYKNAEAIDSYMRDYGQSNGPVGHRRWLLWPRLQEIGVGNTSETNAIWVLGNAGTPPSDAPEFISWPPQGYTPKQVAYERWSFSIAGADFNNTALSMKDQNGQSIPLTVEALDSQYGDLTIVWVPSLNVNTISEDTPFTVTLENVVVNGQAKHYEYLVTLFDAAN